MAAPHTAFSRGSLMLLRQLFTNHSSHMVGHTDSGAWQSHPIPPPFLHGGDRSSFLGLVPPDDTVNSELALGVNPDDSGVVIGYQVDKFTHT